MTNSSFLPRLVCLAVCLVVQPAPAGDQTDLGKLASVILTKSPRAKGVCLDIGCSDGGLLLAVAKASSFFVQGLEDEELRVEAAKRNLFETGLYGSHVAVEKGSLQFLPYPDYCANLVICGDLLSQGLRGREFKEIERVLQPGGVAVLLQASRFRPPCFSKTSLEEALAAAGIGKFEVVEEEGFLQARIEREAPAGMGAWDHGREGTAGNNRCAEDLLVKAPFQTLWIGGPKYLTKFGLVVAARGRYFLRHGGIVGEGRYDPREDKGLLQAFDGYNGVLLWEVHLPEELGTDLIAVGGQVVVNAGRLLLAYDAETGRELWRLKPEDLGERLRRWKRYLAEAGVLVAALAEDEPSVPDLPGKPANAVIALDPRSGRRIWEENSASRYGPAVAGEEKLFLFIPPSTVRALEMSTGKQVWEVEARIGNDFRFYRGRVYTCAGVFNAKNGERLSPNSAKGILAGELAWEGSLKGGAILATDPLSGKTERFPFTQDPFCPKTGVPGICPYMYGRCITSTATPNCFFFSFSGTVAFDLIEKKLIGLEAFRTNCRTGVIAGNGLVYDSPSGCGCTLAVRGTGALLPVSARMHSGQAPGGTRPALEEGPAFRDEISVTSSPGDWPAFRHDAARSAVTSVALPASLSTRWEVKLPGKITPPVAAQGMVFVGTDTHALFALDAQTGRERWKAVLGGALLAPPSYWNGRVYAGSLDGFAYCFRAADGKAVWRYRGGPYERKLVYEGRLQSLWPLSGGVLVEDGVAYFYAGMCAHDRAFVQAVDARTGKLLWDNDTAGNAAETFGPQTGIAPHGLSPFGIPAASKEVLYVPHSQYWPAAFSRADGKLLWWNKRGEGMIRPNIEVQPLGGAELSLAGELLFAGGFSALAGQSQRFFAIEARTGRPFGADDTRLFERAGRDAEGKMIPERIKRCVFGTKAISFGWGSPPLAEGGEVFLNEGAVRAYRLSAYLETQFEKGALQPLWGKVQCYEDLAAIAGGAVVLIGRADKDGKAGSPILRLVSKATGEGIRSVAGTGDERIIPDGVAIADGRCFAVTNRGKVMAFGE